MKQVSRSDERPSGQRREAVLVVDDEPDVLVALRDSLAAYLPDVEVVTASSGTEALQELRRHPIDLIITDYRMPEMDGLEFLDLARHLAPTVPRIVITAYPDLDLAIKALNKEQIAHFITKPLRPKGIVDAVNEVLDERRSRRQRNNALVAALQAMRHRGT